VQGVPTIVAKVGSSNSAWVRNVAIYWAIFQRLPSKVVNIHYGTTASPSRSEVLALRLARKMSVLTRHHPERLAGLSWRKRSVIAIALRLASQVAVDTQFTSGILSQDLPGSLAVNVIPLGVPLPAMSRSSRACARQAFGVPDKAFVVGYLGRLVRYKGLDLVIEALGTMDHSVVLLVAGEGEDGVDLEREAKRRLGDRVTFLGRVPDSGPFYRSVDVLAMPSSLEGFGLVYVEAALYGVRSVASPTGGVPYVVKNGQSGFIVTRTVEAVGNAISRLRADPGLIQTMG
jgi:glycosyltransferase involved in cell wall biosynthesis